MFPSHFCVFLNAPISFPQYVIVTVEEVLARSQFSTPEGKIVLEVFGPWNMPTTRIDTEDDILEMELTSSSVECARNHRLSNKLAISEEDNGSKLYRRSKSEDPNFVNHSAMRPKFAKTA